MLAFALLLLYLFVCTRSNLIIFDHDGGVDDFQALVKLIQHQISTKHNHHKLIGITTVRGNIDNQIALDVTRSMLQLFRPLAHDHLNEIKLYLGADAPLLATPLPAGWPGHGTNGIGTFKFPPVFDTNSSEDACDQSAVNMHASLGILELIETHHTENKVDVIAVGPLTNIALALKLNSDLFCKINSLWIMGGTVYAQGNAKSMGEFNFVSDVEAAKIVMDHSHLIKIYVVPIDAMKHYPLTEWQPMLMQMTKDKENNFMHHMMWSMNQWITSVQETPVAPECVLPDLVAVTAYLYQEQVIKNMVEVSADIELCGSHSRGALAIDWKNVVKTPQDFDALSNDEKKKMEHKWWVSNKDCNQGEKRNDKICVIEQMNHDFILKQFQQMTEFECAHCAALYD